MASSSRKPSLDAVSPRPFAKRMELERWGLESLGPAVPCLDGDLRPGGVEVSPEGKTTCPQETLSGHLAAPVIQWSWGRQAFREMPTDHLLILVGVSRFCLYEKYTQRALWYSCSVR